MSNIAEIEAIVAEWNRRTLRLLKYERGRKNVGDTGELDKTMRERTYSQGNKVVAETAMLVRGRFVDGGYGKGQNIGRGASFSRRVPKKWYSPTFYGRLNDLQGVVGYNLMEQTMNAVKNPFLVVK